MQIRFQLSLFTNRSFIINYVILIMAQDTPKRRFLSLIFLSCFALFFVVVVVAVTRDSDHLFSLYLQSHLQVPAMDKTVCTSYLLCINRNP